MRKAVLRPGGHHCKTERAVPTIGLNPKPADRPADWVTMRISRAHIITAGAVLIAAGVLTIVRQALTTGPVLPPIPGDFSLARWIASTEFPGLPMICVGALLWALAAVTRS